MQDIKVLIPSDVLFWKYDFEIQKLYEENQKKITDTNTYHFVRDNTLFYAFFLGENLIGFIYYFVDEEGKLFLNGCCYRKMFPINIVCLQKTFSWFNCDIYAEAQNRASAFCLLKAGFVKNGSGNVYRFYNKNKQGQEVKV